MFLGPYTITTMPLVVTYLDKVSPHNAQEHETMTFCSYNFQSSFPSRKTLGYPREKHRFY